MSVETDECWRRGLLGYKLHNGQIELREWWAKNGARICMFNIARRWGKSTLLAVLALEHAIRTPNARVVYAAPTREQTRDITEPIFRALLVDCPDDARPRYDAARNFYRFANGAEIHIDGADDERGARLRGSKATLALADELGFWRYPLEVIKSVILPQTITCGGRILIASTPPESIGHPFWDLANEAKERAAYVVRTIHDSPLVTPQLIEEYANESGGQQSTVWRREYLCERVTETERAVLPEFSVAQHVGEVARPDYVDGYVSIDLGMQDLTHAVFGYYRFEDAQVVIEDEVVTSSQPVSEIAPLLSAKERELWGAQKPTMRISDNHPMEIAEFGRQHLLQPDKVPSELKFSPANNQNPEALINRCRSMLKAGRVLIHPRCVRLIAQCEGGLWNARRTDFERIPSLGHLDGVMALVYLLDRMDYTHNPAWRAPLNTETHATYQNKREVHRRYGSLTKLLPPSVRRN